MRPIRFVAALVLAALAVSGCSIRTAGSPVGDTTLVARFDDVQHLVVGHTVRLADVPVGTVTAVELDGYDAVVELSISDSIEIPDGTTAAISATSLLGENFVRLKPPTVASGVMLGDGDLLDTVGADASFEEITIELLALFRAIQGRDLATVINESHAALAGRGEQLNTLISTVSEVGDGLVVQNEDLIAIIDSLGQFGDDLVDHTDLLGESIASAADATGSLAAQRERMVQTVEEIVGVANTLDDEVLLPHTQRLETILARLAPTAEVLADNRNQLVGLLDATLRTNDRIPEVITDDGVGEGFIILDGVYLSDDGYLPLGGLLPLSAERAIPANLRRSAPDTIGDILFGPHTRPQP